MNARQTMRRLPDGRRLHLGDGPIDLIIEAWGARAAVEAAYAAAMARFATILDELCAELPSLRAPSGEAAPKSPVGLRMARAVAPFAPADFITPMAAVAGSVADEIADAMSAAATLDRLAVNNGGDIALRLAPGQSFALGLVDRPDKPSLFARATLNAADHIGGVATSGWRGRSFSLGIADAVSVLADCAAAADAAATLIANAVDLPGHAAIARAPADSLQPDSDLGPRLVTRGVGALTPQEIDAALGRGMALAEAFEKSARIRAAALHLAGRTLTMGAVAALEAPMGRANAAG